MISYQVGQTSERPWGCWRVLGIGNGYVTKEIIVRPGGALSLQHHRHRSEHWIIVKGQATVTLGDETRLYKPNDTVFIPIGTKHSVANDTSDDLIFVEVHIGDELREDDIVRHYDRYGRR